MKRFLLALALAVSAALLAGPVAAQDNKAKKADVTLKADDKTGRAKVGQTIEIPLPTAPAEEGARSSSPRGPGASGWP